VPAAISPDGIAAPAPASERVVPRRGFFAATIGAGALVLAWSFVNLIQRPPEPIWLVLIALTCFTGASPVRMPGFPLSLSLSDTFTITAALLFGPSAGALTVACDSLVISLRLNPINRSATRVLFNVTAPALAMWVAASLLFRVTGSELRAGTIEPPLFLGSLALFATTYFFLNSILVTAAVVIGRGAPLWAVWREHFLPLWLPHFAGTSIAGFLLVLNTAGLATTSTLVLSLPLLLVVAFGLNAAVDRLRIREARLAELRSYAAALRSTADGVILTDPENRITFVNTAAERLTGWAAAEAPGRPVADVLRLRPLTEDAGEGPDIPGGIREYVLTRRNDGTLEVEESHAEIRDEDGTVTGVISTFRDISRRKALESERREALQRAEDARVAADAANRAKDEFLATLSHELRTPATAIMGWTHVLRSGRLDAADTLRALAALDRSARAQNAVLHDLLDLSRIVRGALRLQVRRVRIDEPLREALETMEPAAEAKSLTVRVAIDPNLPVIDADPERLRQVFWNLLSNAVKFTPEGGEIEISARLLDNTVRVEVADNGCGIDREFLPLVFDQFRQADSSVTRKYGGLGLGLAIVKHVVEAHGGTVEAASDGRGKGARFAVSLRVALRRRGSDIPGQQLPPDHAPG
jgi:PAS domain S-box-containing protein